MSIYGISDLHLDYSKTKPMDIFGQKWINHEEKIFEFWQKNITNEDIVLVSGDISWALKLDEAYMDLKRINDLPGQKIISKGNHDYWWETKKKLNALNLETIHFLHNDSYTYNNIVICGTRGWAPKDSDEFKKHDEKMYNRELNRLELSLKSADSQACMIIVMLHYPPFNIDGSINDFVHIMKEYDVKKCVYGHLHAEGHRFAIEGKIEGIDFYCISSDFIDFKAQRLL